MRSLSRSLVSLVLIVLVAPWCAAQSPSRLELRAGDRVVLLGDTLIEREQASGWVELMLTTRFPDRDITFRNLGWSGDTPAGDARFGLSLLQAGREPSDEGWRQLVKQIEEAKRSAQADAAAREANVTRLEKNLRITRAKITPIEAALGAPAGAAVPA